MKRCKIFLAGNLLLALTFAVGSAQATCPCRKPKQPLPPQEELKAKKNSPDKTLLLTASEEGSLPIELAARKPKPLPRHQEQMLYGDMARRADANKKLFGGKKAQDKPTTLQGRGWCYGSNAQQFPAVTHHISEVDPAGSMISIQDGSAFTVKESDQSVAKNWGINSPIYVKPNSLSFWNKLMGTKPLQKYCLVNMNSGKSVEATLALGPYKHSPHARQILQLDGVTGDIFLNNGACYRLDLSGTCAEIFKSWKAGHFVILGMNDTWFSLGNQFVMIDVDTDNWLPATRVY